MIIKRRRLPILIIEGKVIKNVITVPLRVLLPLKKNRILAILKLLIIVIEGPS